MLPWPRPAPDAGGPAEPNYSIKFQRLPTLLTAAAVIASNPNALPNADIHQFKPVPSARCGEGNGTVMTVLLARTSRCSWTRRATSAWMSSAEWRALGIVWKVGGPLGGIQRAGCSCRYESNSAPAVTKVVTRIGKGRQVIDS